MHLNIVTLAFLTFIRLKNAAYVNSSYSASSFAMSGPNLGELKYCKKVKIIFTNSSSKLFFSVEI